MAGELMGGGESYMDVKERCHRILMKLVGTRESVLVVAHKVILQVIMSYFLDIPAEQMPSIEVKENTVYELEPTAYCTKTKECTLLND
jgi:singapore isolate B (sub-type 7) whole genome shotgun sequence assembly, scaffold_3